MLPHGQLMGQGSVSLREMVCSTLQLQPSGQSSSCGPAPSGFALTFCRITLSNFPCCCCLASHLGCPASSSRCSLITICCSPADYSCALQRDILLQGRLYLSENWICFYSNIFRWETLVRLSDWHTEHVYYVSIFADNFKSTHWSFSPVSLITCFLFLPSPFCMALTVADSSLEGYLLDDQGKNSTAHS